MGRRERASEVVGGLRRTLSNCLAAPLVFGPRHPDSSADRLSTPDERSAQGSSGANTCGYTSWGIMLAQVEKDNCKYFLRRRASIRL